MLWPRFISLRTGTRQHVDLRSTASTWEFPGNGHRTRSLASSCWRCGPLYNTKKTVNTLQPHSAPVPVIFVLLLCSSGQCFVFFASLLSRSAKGSAQPTKRARVYVAPLLSNYPVRLPPTKRQISDHSLVYALWIYDQAFWDSKHASPLLPSKSKQFVV